LSTTGNYRDSLEVGVSVSGKNTSSFSRLGYLLVPKATWTRVAFKLPMSIIRYVSFRYLLYNGGPNGNNSDKVSIDDVQILRYSSTAVGEPSAGIPDQFQLGQNYPNPFNPATVIEYTVGGISLPAMPAGRQAGQAGGQGSGGSNVRLVVYDLLGREVATLVNEQQAPGSHQVTFDATGLTTGVYLYRLTAGTYTATRRMVVMK
jgi:hypothetical protein